MSKVILITGASTGLGATLAGYLAGKGHTVYATSRHIEQGSAAYNVLNMDVGSEESIRRAVETIVQRHGRIDVLINNAGLGIAGPIESVAAADVQRVFDTNVLGVIRTSQAVLPSMRQQRSGLIINISSIGSETGLPYRGVYSASKAALDRITEALRIELAPFGVQACYVQPGGIRTDINKNRITAPLAQGNVYKESFERCYRLVNDSVSGGMAPEAFGPVVENIMVMKKVPRCIRVGKPLEKVSVLLKRLLPESIYEKMIANHYKVYG
ncbi:SDR family oxidoreductase [Paraflavisolibacter sp. H34]|uniref:SDR family oxidoreductase n=1 Tax=Huijunlia imazamoxiresistens TaxID=3127457 RepID=UPI00301812F8